MGGGCGSQTTATLSGASWSGLYVVGQGKKAGNVAGQSLGAKIAEA